MKPSFSCRPEHAVIMNTQSDHPRIEPISMVLRWRKYGLDLLDAPERMENYYIPPQLQRSLRESEAPQVPDASVPPSGRTIPFGVVANLLVQTGWCRLNLNFEPGTDRRLRLYMSVSDPHPPDAVEPVRVHVWREERPFSRDLFDKRGTYRSPPLPPGDYVFRLTQGKVVLSRVTLSLQ